MISDELIVRVACALYLVCVLGIVRLSWRRERL